MARYTNDGVCHAWAHDTDTYPSNHGGTLYAENATLYSYGPHYPIATRHRSRSVILFCSERSTVTTEKQKTIARRAIPPKYKVLDVIDVNACAEHAHGMNLRDITERFNQSLEKAARARVNADWHLSQANRLREMFIDYRNAFADEITGNYVAPPLPRNLADIKKRIAKANAEKRKAERAKEKQRQIDNAKKIKAWVAGEKVHLPMLKTVYMRVNGDYIETSHGAMFPVADALKALPFILNCVKHGWSYIGRNDTGNGYMLGHYKIDTISRTGTVVAGCHTVKLEQIKQAAKMLQNGTASNAA